MSLSLLAIVVLVVLGAGYLLYGTFIARQYRLDDAHETPASRVNDGVDFVPTRPFYLMSQHFSAIAAAGPIVGPIIACQAFGWQPCLLWILLGVILIGAVHDFSALVASVRHGAHSVAELARDNLGPRAWLVLVAFIWLALVYVIVAFTDVTAKTFLGKDEVIAGIEGTFNRGGAVAAASTMYLLLSLVMGFVQRYLRPPMWLLTLIFVPATLLVIWLGTKVSGILVFDAVYWHAAILVYCFVASLLPMWVLQQPRGYLGGFVLYLAIGVGLAGVLLGGFTIQQPGVRTAAEYGAAYSGWWEGGAVTGMVLPFLFVTIACGACSGFHGLVCGGTTSKQVAKESHCKPIAFGAMLLEGLVAVIALATVMVAEPSSLIGKGPSQVYGDGLARFVTTIVGDQWLVFAKTFGSMAVATFIFDTLDVSTRLGRYLLQELTGRRGWAAGWVAAGLTAGVPMLVLLTASDNSYMKYWVLFGTSNQLLAGLTLLGVTVWLARQGRRYWYTLLPMLFIMTITLTALSLQIADGARAMLAARASQEPEAMSTAMTAGINAAVGVALLLLAAVFVVEALRAVRKPLVA